MKSILAAVVYSITSGLGAIVAAGKLPSDAVEWCGFALVVIASGWGKYTNSEDVIAHPMASGRDLKIGK